MMSSNNIDFFDCYEQRTDTMSYRTTLSDQEALILTHFQNNGLFYKLMPPATITLESIVTLSKHLHREIGLRYNKTKQHFTLIAGHLSAKNNIAQAVHFGEKSDSDSDNEYQILMHTHPTLSIGKAQLNLDLNHASKDVELVINFNNYLFIYREDKILCNSYFNPDGSVNINNVSATMVINIHDLITIELFTHLYNFFPPPVHTMTSVNYNNDDDWSNGFLAAPGSESEPET